MPPRKKKAGRGRGKSKGRGRGRGRGASKGRGRGKTKKKAVKKKITKAQLKKQEAEKKRARKWKDPTKPKRALSAYNLMARDLRDEIKSTLHPDAKATEIMKAIATYWSNMNEAEKEPYRERAAEAKVDQQAAMAKWKATAVKRRAPRGSKKYRDPTKPKRPKSAYLFFTEAHREQVKEDLGSEAKATEIMAELGALWRKTPQRQRSQYEKMAVEAKEEYNQALLAWSNMQQL